PWNNFVTALSAARADMDYGNMTASAIESACQTRYTNLWNAYVALISSPAANNASIHQAVEADENVGNTYKADNRDGRWSETRWNTFKDAYLEAAGAIEQGGKYSDYNVRNYDEDEQDAIDEIAERLTFAYEDLLKYGKRADFSPVINAAKDIVVDPQGQESHTLQSDLYTVQSLEALSLALKNASRFPYLNMSEEEKLVTYSEQNTVNAIAAEARSIKSAYSEILVEKAQGVDESALESAKAYAKSQIKNPDAYSNIDEIKALIDSAGNSRSVTLFDDYAVNGVIYPTEEEINAAITELLSGLNIKKYDVQVVDENGTPISAVFKDEEGNVLTETGPLSADYGTKVIVYAPENEESDWFYSYSSNTVSKTPSKYYTTDKWIHITVRGDTTLTLKNASTETETVKVTYVNAQTGKTFAVDYAQKNNEYALEEAPTLAYYTFAGYSLEAGSEDYVTAITPSEDTVVFANYEFDTTKEYFTVTLGNVNGSITTTQYLPEDLEFNDLVEFRLGDGTYGGENSGLYQTGKKNNGQYKVNEETSNLPGTAKNPIRYTSSEIYAWTVVKEDDMDDWDEYRGVDYAEDLIQNVEKVVMYGDTYSFRVCENVYVIPYTQEEFEEAVNDGLIEGVSAQEKAAVYANDKILNETGGQKISMIGNFTLPENCELVETGMLFKATTNKTVPEADLSLANAGTNGIVRMKSSSHTAGNQFVISVNTKKFIGTNTTINVIYKGYLIYTDGTQQYTVYSNNVTDSALI
ncbi:MAG: hypothetical protein IKR97_00730, partial [Eubacterium sp.]|nr:hypothetical protein [Eubacterium sp.]